MRDNSGKGNSENNRRDPTLDEQRPKNEGPRTEGSPGDLVGLGKEEGGQRSPSDRARGEAAPGESAAAMDPVAERAR